MDAGRFNRPGVEALYLSRAPQTALEEYKQGASITPPATLAAYKITLSEIADLSQGFDPNAWDSAGRAGAVPGARSPALTRKSRHHEARDVIITAGLRGMCFRRCATPAAPTW
ncbi:RES domain-containing protein [Mesorhizobium comanense]|uniref:RES domain-containing protein n=1 Tax=Mesorhizobium comanense TaxID=2502215 RepID=UPI001E48A149|nr:RES domain-containing protein [Mesorhizobium comanense]